MAFQRPQVTDDNPAGCYKLQCEYYGDTTKTCDYMLQTGRRRPRDENGICTHSPSKKYKPQKFSMAQFLSLYMDGLIDAEIAEKTGASPSTISRYRNYLNLPPNVRTA